VKLPVIASGAASRSQPPLVTVPLPPST